jgi:hypothetical protein
VAAIKQHEADWLIGIIHREIERDTREKRGHFSFDIAAVLGCEEVMRRIHCSPPDFHNPSAVRYG